MEVDCLGCCCRVMFCVKACVEMAVRGGDVRRQCREDGTGNVVSDVVMVCEGKVKHWLVVLDPCGGLSWWSLVWFRVELRLWWRCALPLRSVVSQENFVEEICYGSDDVLCMLLGAGGVWGWGAERSHVWSVRGLVRRLASSWYGHGPKS